MKYKVMTVAILAALSLALPFSLAATPAAKTAPVVKTKIVKSAALVAPVKTVAKPAAVAPVLPAVPAVNLLEGTTEAPHWLGNEKALVSHQSADGLEFAVIDLATKKSAVVVEQEKNATEAVASPDGSKIAYVNNNGEIFLLDTASKEAKKLTTDNDPKLELQFSKDGSKLYFLSGDKVDTINAINLADLVQTKILADKVPYKSDLSISADGKKALYTVTNPGTTNDADGSFAVDIKNTEPQFYTVPIAAGGLPVQVTKTLDNKISSTLLADGGILFISANTDGSYTAPALTKISADGKVVAPLGNGMYAYQAVQNADGSISVLALNFGGEKVLYSIGVDGKIGALVSVDKNLTTLVPSQTASVLLGTAATAQGEKVVLVKEGKLVDLSK